jgi:hypothetical protein
LNGEPPSAGVVSGGGSPQKGRSRLAMSASDRSRSCRDRGSVLRTSTNRITAW